MTKQPIKTGVAIEQPKRHNIECVANMTGDEKTCNCGLEQPNQNLMIFEQIEGCCEIIEKLLNQLIPKTTQVEDCIITHKAWQDNNLKHVKEAFE